MSLMVHIHGPLGDEKNEPHAKTYATEDGVASKKWLPRHGVQA